MSELTERLRHVAWLAEEGSEVTDLAAAAADALEAAEKRITELEHAYEVLAHSCSDEAEVAGWKLHTAEAKLAAIDALCDIAMDPVGYGTYFAQQVKAILHPEEEQ